MTNAISENFSKNATNYNDHAIIQKIVAENLVNKYTKYLINGINILDIGSGTGFLSNFMEVNNINNNRIFELDFAYKMCQISKQNTRQKMICHQINADFDNIPIKQNSMDIVVSSMSMQWSKNLEALLKNIYDVLKNSGYFIFTIPTDGSFAELKSTMNIKMNKLPSFGEVDNILNNANFEKIEAIREVLKIQHNNLINLLKSITKVGAGIALSKNDEYHKKNLTKNYLQKMERIYIKNHGQSNKIPLSWEISYFAVKKL